MKIFDSFSSKKFKLAFHVPNNCAQGTQACRGTPVEKHWSIPCWWWGPRTRRPDKWTCDGLRPRRVVRPSSTSCSASGSLASWTPAWLNLQQRCPDRPKRPRSLVARVPAIENVYNPGYVEFNEKRQLLMCIIQNQSKLSKCV